jgi:glycosyltransferase involved in cell wall biosynthesis
MTPSSGTDSPLVSVCIPTYRRADRLRRAVLHVLEGTYPNIEVIVSDNASPDHTESVVNELAGRDPRVRYFRQETNQGPTRNFEFARSQARGKYFMWLADDDYMDPDYIRRSVLELEADASLVLVSGLGAYHTGDRVIRFRGNVIQGMSHLPLWRALRYVFLMEDNSIFYGVYRREAVADCALPNRFTGDSIWLAEVLLAGRAKVLADNFLYRESSDNMSSSPERIVAGLGAPSWQGQYPWLAVPWNVASGIAFGSWRFKQSHVMERCAVFVLFFTVSFAKQWILRIMGKLPYGRELYKKIFASEMGIV